jgi:hypothetical protein
VNVLKSWWKMALVGVGILFVISLIGGLIVGSPSAKATADNAVKACRSSDYAPRPELLGSRSSVRPDGTWTPQEDWPGTYSMDQLVSNESAYGNRYTSKPWRCTATMAKDGIWTAEWFSDIGVLMGTWHVKNADLRSVAPPRDLSGPGSEA